MLAQQAADSGWNWETTLDDDPDRVLGSQYALVATADAPVLDRAEQWANAARWIIDEHVPEAWIVPLALEP
jgi:hypothetical protein